MEKKIKLIATDLDGTLLDENENVSLATHGAVQRAAQSGIVFVPATGRQLASVPAEVISLPGVTYVLTSNGARVSDIIANKTLYTNCIDANIAAKLVGEILQFRCALGAYAGGRGYRLEGNTEPYEAALEPKWYEYYLRTREAKEDLAGFLAKQQDGVEKFTLHFNEAKEKQRAFEYFKTLGYVAITHSSPSNIELNAPTANKGEAVMALAKILGFERAEVMAMGDSHNDIAMLQAVGYPVAMGNAEPEVRAVAKHITASNSEDGAAKAISSVL